MSLRNNILVSFFALFLLSACGPSEVHHQTAQVGEKGWHKDSVAVFNSEITEIDRSYHVLIEVQTNEKYPYSNMWFFVDAISPSGKAERDTVQGYFSTPNGEWLGEKLWFKGAYLTNQAYKINIKFPEKGMYKYYVAQGMRDSVIYGIDAVGIRIFEAEQ